MEWKPIDSAPKDGTELLFLQTAPGDYENTQSVGRWQKIPAHEVWVLVDKDTSKRKIIEESGYWSADKTGLTPDYWQPLPAPPTAPDPTT